VDTRARHSPWIISPSCNNSSSGPENSKSKAFPSWLLSQLFRCWSHWQSCEPSNL
jgi:hypothetical protein